MDRFAALAMTGIGLALPLRDTAYAKIDPPRNGEGDHTKCGGGAHS
jgi:hypothetical protein